jgi:hypothetical protein
LEKKWLEGRTGLKNDPQGRQVFPLAGGPLEKFLATLLDCPLPRLLETMYPLICKKSRSIVKKEMVLMDFDLNHFRMYHFLW